MTQQIFQATPVWQRLFEALDRLDGHGMGALHHMAKTWRANLPPDLIDLLDTLDALRDLPVALLADRHGVTVAEIEALIQETLAEMDDASG